MSSSATAAVINASVIRAAETGTARSANHWPARNGWMIAELRSSTRNTSTLCSPLPAEMAAIALQKQRSRLWHSISHGRRDAAHDRRRPKASGRGDRLLRRSPHVGVQFVAPPPSSRGGARGGLSPDGNQWISCRSGYFLPVQVLSRLFRRLFIEALEKAFVTVSWRFSPLWLT